MNRFDGPRPRRGVTLEMSLKPFFSVDEETIRAVCRRMFIQWKPPVSYTHLTLPTKLEV